MNDEDRLLDVLLDAVGDRIDAEVSAQNKTTKDRIAELESMVEKLQGQTLALSFVLAGQLTASDRILVKRMGELLDNDPLEGKSPRAKRIIKTAASVYKLLSSTLAR